MTNKLLSTISSFSFKSHSSKRNEKRRLLKMCQKQLKMLQNKDCVSVKTVLLKNTIKVIEKQKDSGDDLGVSEDDVDGSPGYIESLLKEIYLDQTNQSSTSSSLPLSTATNSNTDLRISDVLEEFHNCGTYSQNQLIFKEDPSIFLDSFHVDDETGFLN